MADTLKNEIKVFVQQKWNSTNIERFPGPQPISIEKKHIPILLRNDYYVCEKTDGVRHFLVCFTDSCKRKICALVNRSFDYTLYPLTVPRDTLLDGELLDDEFIVHDAVCIQGEDLREKPLNVRLGKTYMLSKVIIPSTIRVSCKRMIPYKDMASLKLHEKTDGVIFTPINEPVRMGTHRTLFKWKPLERITIDFLIRNGNFCIQHEGKMLKVQHDQEFKDEGIFECEFYCDKWKPLKKRTDKSHPNNKMTYERTLINIRENIKFCDLVPT
jgi:hypothetical protein